MAIIFVLAITFVLMLISPIVFSTIYYKKRKSTVLHINQERIRDARYFGKNFAKMVQGRLSEAKNNVILLSKEETFLDTDLAKANDYKEEMEQMVIARKKEFTAPATVKSFWKEIYCENNARILEEGTRIRAAYCRQNMILGNGILVVRWVDAEKTLAIYDHCDLGISASAGELLSIGRDCNFQRIFAPEIQIGQYPDDHLDPAEGKDPRIFRLTIQVNKERNMRYISKEMINEDGIVDFSVLSWRNLTVTEKIIIQGDVRSQRGVRLCDNAVVCGNIFAEGDVLLGKNTAVLGNVFSQGNIVLEERATVGQRGRICSVIARNHITFHGRNFVFGYVSAERGGRVLPYPEGVEIPKKKFQFLPKAVHLQHLRFKDLYDFEHVDQQGFRKEKMLEDVVVPSGATVIPKSMFFSCKKLTWIEMPAEIREIRDYAFADCEAFEEIRGFEHMALERVGTSAFENCKRLKELQFPKCIKSLEGAAFAGCEDLRKVEFAPEAVLERIGDHCFRDCAALEEMIIPDSVTYLGVSSFRGCSALKRLSLPEHLSETAELERLTKQGVELIFRVLVEEEENETKDAESTEAESTNAESTGTEQPQTAN